MLNPQTRYRRKSGSEKGTLMYLVGGSMIAAIFIVPLLWEVLRSLQPPGAVISPPSMKSFSQLGFSNFNKLLYGDHILRNVLNSLIVAVATAVVTAVVATFAGYGFGHFRFRGSGTLFGLVLLGFMVPFQAVVVPLFLELKFFHLLNSLPGLVFFYTAFNLPFGTYLMRNTFRQLPSEITDSAKVDGASVITTLTRVLRPLVVPGVATTVLYAFLFSWTEFLGALTFITNDSIYTLPVALVNVEASDTYGQIDYGVLVAGAVIAMVPCVIIYVALQRYYVRGLVSGAVKG
ncbi:MAG TPA: carbohydrate ABC transporter permease [Acidimicrobiales bacterium]|nr:carbohydrate ABC transporter permease [Acidimicrobiales bacterium]